MKNILISTNLLKDDVVNVVGEDEEFTLLAMDYSLTISYNQPIWVAIGPIQDGKRTIVTANEKCIELLRREKSY